MRRIASGTTDQYVYFQRQTGLSSFTVYRSRNGAAWAAMTTPTISEGDSVNAPGIYELLLDEDMTIGAGNVTEDMAFYITHAGMTPVFLEVELFSVAELQSGLPTAAQIADAVWDEDATGHQTQGTFGQAIGDPVADTNTIFKAVVTDATAATAGLDVVSVLGRLPAALVSGRMDSSVGAMAANVLTATAINNDALTAAKVAADVGTEIGTAVWATTTRVLTAATNLTALASQASVDDLPTNAELATALGSADDATLAAISALNNLSAAQAETAAGAALTAYDPPTRAEATSDANSILTAVGDVPTNSEFTTALAGADDAVLAAISALNNVSVANILAATVEGSTTLVETLRLLNAALGGKASGLATTTAVYRDIGDTKPRITATVDSSGNRSAVTLDLS